MYVIALFVQNTFAVSFISLSSTGSNWFDGMLRELLTWDYKLHERNCLLMWNTQMEVEKKLNWNAADFTDIDKVELEGTWGCPLMHKTTFSPTHALPRLDLTRLELTQLNAHTSFDCSEIHSTRSGFVLFKFPHIFCSHHNFPNKYLSILAIGTCDMLVVEIKQICTHKPMLIKQVVNLKWIRNNILAADQYSKWKHSNIYSSIECYAQCVFVFHFRHSTAIELYMNWIFQKDELIEIERKSNSDQP